jgi:hypothetical protein
LSNLARPRPLEEPEEPDEFEQLARRLVSAARRLPAGVTGPALVIAGLVLADRFGAGIPGARYAARVFNDPIVFLAVRLLVIVGLLAVGAVVAWAGLSASSHIKNRRWIRRIAGFEPQELHRGAKEVQGGLDDLRQVLSETRDWNAELLVALERTTQYAIELAAENEELRRRLSSPGGEGYQLQIGDGR